MFDSSVVSISPTGLFVASSAQLSSSGDGALINQGKIIFNSSRMDSTQAQAIAVPIDNKLEGILVVDGIMGRENSLRILREMVFTSQHKDKREKHSSWMFAEYSFISLCVCFFSAMMVTLSSLVLVPWFFLSRLPPFLLRLT